MWDWLFGTKRVWIEIKKFDDLEIITRTLSIKPFGGVYTIYYDCITEGKIELFPDGKGKCDRDYIEILRWAPLHHRKLRAKYQVALTMGALDKKWPGDIGY